MLRNVIFKIMNRTFLGLAFLLVFAFPLYAEEQEKISFQGVTGAFDQANRLMIVNEGKVLLTPETEYMNHKERKISPSEWTSGKWVYVVGHLSSKGPVADKLYLLPGQVKGKEMVHYPFMMRDGEDENSERNGR